MAIICTICSASNPDGMRFCDQCASPLPDSEITITNNISAPTPLPYQPPPSSRPDQSQSYPSASIPVASTRPTPLVMPPTEIVTQSYVEMPSFIATSSQVMPPTEIITQSYPTPSRQSSYTPPPIQPPTPVSYSGSGTIKLVVTRGATLGQEFMLSPGDNEIGRWDEDDGYYPHVDLDKQDSEGFVHRRHAFLRFKNGQWYLEDAGGANGTKLRHNGQTSKVFSGSPVVVQEGDELIIGRVFLRFERA